MLLWTFDVIIPWVFEEAGEPACMMGGLGAQAGRQVAYILQTTYYRPPLFRGSLKLKASLEKVRDHLPPVTLCFITPLDTLRKP